MLIYKILLPPEWDTFDTDGEFVGSPLDVDSGYVHCSSGAQVASTVASYFPDEPELVLVALDTGKLGGSLRWEEAPEGELFPHVHGPLPRSAVVGIRRAPAAKLVGRYRHAEQPEPGTL